MKRLSERILKTSKEKFECSHAGCCTSGGVSYKTSQEFIKELATSSGAGRDISINIWSWFFKKNRQAIVIMTIKT